MGLLLTYIVLKLFIPTQYMTSPHTCTPKISPSSVSFIYMIASPRVEFIFIHEFFHGGH